MNAIDKWAAAQVGVKFEQTWRGQVWRLNGKLHENDEWTIEDPRCREVFRDWWLGEEVMRQVCFSNESVIYFDYSMDEMGVVVAHGLKEGGGEGFCITAIYEASQ